MKVEKLIPEVYYSQSRDFSYIGRLFEVLFNYMKTGADSVMFNRDSPDIDATTIELLALTLGFESKHKYTTRDLIYIISSFSDLIKKKGTKEAINTAIRLLINSQKIKINNIVDFIGTIPTTGENQFILDLKIPAQLTGTVLLEDLFDYILPAGMLYKFTKVEPSDAKYLEVNPDFDTEHAYSINQDTSQILSDPDGGYVFVLLTEEPANWGTNYGDYYVYSEGSGFVLNEESEYSPGSYYKKEKNKHIGTIITGTVFDGGNS
ncbi:MAG: hypothetical protein M0Q88_00435 [Bacilli bacterium]|nr:hypothetical protein [Bacilli bacterium]